MPPNGKIHIDIKPLSVNEAYRGKRYNTPKKKQWTKDVMKLLMASGPIKLFPKMEIEFWFGIKANADWDNPIKAFQDVLQKKYGFNDSAVYRGIANKVVGKGEFIAFEIREFKDEQVSLF